MNTLRRIYLLYYLIFFFFFFSVFFFFKQKTAYEISACLVGSEMCIRDRHQPSQWMVQLRQAIRVSVLNAWTKRLALRFSAAHAIAQFVQRHSALMPGRKPGVGCNG